MNRLAKRTAVVGIAGAVMSTALVAAPAGAVVTPQDCAFRAPNQNYTQNSPDGLTGCVTKANGTYLHATVLGSGRVTAGVGQPVRFLASFKVLPRGDVRQWVTYRFIRGNKVITKKVRLRAGKKAIIQHRFTRAGQWTVVAVHGKQRISMKIMIQR